MQLDVGNQYVNIDGCLIEKDVYDIAVRIKEYDPNLEIFFVDPAKSDFNEAPFLIAELCPDGQYRRVFETWTLDQSILERIYNADTKRHDILTITEKNNQQAANMAKQRYAEKRAEAQDLVAHILANPKSSYTFKNEQGQIVKIDDHLPPTKKETPS